jgi:hypothetical protein
MLRVERDPERGRAAAAKLKALGVKGILIQAAEQGYITQLACKMPECFCPEELGGACYFEPVTNDWSDWRSDWMPTVEHFPVYRKDGGKETVDNVILAHRLCNRLDHSLRVGRSHGRDLERIRNAREEGIRRNNARIGNPEGGESPTVEAEAATPKPRRTEKRRTGRPCLTPRRRSTSSMTRRSPIASGRTSRGSRASSVKPLSGASWDSRRRLRRGLRWAIAQGTFPNAGRHGGCLRVTEGVRRGSKPLERAEFGVPTRLTREHQRVPARDSRLRTGQADWPVCRASVRAL